MEQEEKKEGFWVKLKKPFRLVAINPETFEEKWEFRLSNYNLLTLLSLLILLVSGITTLVFIFTPVGEFLPSVYHPEDKMIAIENNRKIDSLKVITEMHAQYYENFRKVLADENFEDSIIHKNKPNIDVNYDEISDEKSTEDSLLRSEMEMQEVPSNLADENLVETNFFFSPVKGNISSSYDSKKGHFGVDIVASKNATIKATLGGVVIFGNQTTDDGNVIILYHGGDLVTVYKHNSKLLKKVGDKVKSGDPIAIIGNTGEHTTGAHLHFEIWQNGSSIDPEQLISFD